MIYFFLVLLISSVIYAGFISWCYAGWFSLKVFNSHPKNFRTLVSVVVPARNEEQTIRQCLQDLVLQDYPKDLMEIMVVDDDSSDHTAEVVRCFMQNNPAHKIVLMTPSRVPMQTGFKKQAITSAVRNATGELMVTTDADCRMSEKWLSTIVSCYESEHASMIAGPVCFHRERTLFEKMQSLEFMGLIGIGAGSIANHRPVMCNGANLAYTKEMFFRVNGFEAQSDTVSGDDTQLMLKIAEYPSSKICFLKSKNSVVYTGAKSTLKDFFQQRKRWASKIPTAMNSLTLLAAGAAWILHAGLIIVIFLSFFDHSHLDIIFFIFLIKVIPEFVLLYNMSVFFGRRKLLWLFLPAQLVYLVYIAFIGAISQISSYQWKERMIKSDGIKFQSNEK